MNAGSGSRLRGAAPMLFGLALLLLTAGTAFAQPKGESAAPAAGLSAEDKGIVVVAIDPGSPAEKAGIRRGDVLLKADKVELQTAGDLAGYVSRLEPGVSMDISFARGEVSRSVTVELGRRNGEPYLGVTAQGARQGGELGRGRQSEDGGFRLAPWGGTAPSGGAATVEAVVAEVLPEGPAAAAGIARGDRIVSVDGALLQAGGSLAAEVGKRKPGDKISLGVRRATDALRSIEVTLAASPADATKPYLGVRYQEYAGALLGPSRDPFGQAPLDGAGAAVVRQVAAGSPAEKAGIVVGDLITRVGEERVSASRSLADLVASHKPGDSVEIGLSDRAGAHERAVTVTLGASPQDKERAYLGVGIGGRAFALPEVPRNLPRERMQVTPRGRRSDI